MTALIRFCLVAVRILSLKDSCPPATKIFWSWLGLKFGRIGLFLARKSVRNPYYIRLAGHTINGPIYRDLVEMFSEVFISQIYQVPLPGRPKIIDCGSNVGFAVLYFKILAPDARIICFEPSPIAFSYLRKNIEINKFSEVKLVEAACGKENGEVTFLIDPTHSTGSTTKDIWDTKMEKHKVTQIRISDFIDETVDLLKLDVEGAEWDVLRDLEATNKLTFVQRMIIEFHHNLTPEKSNMGPFLEILERGGFAYNIDASCSGAHHFTTEWQGVMLYAWRPASTTLQQA
jgi:FkbM family methyltransferase